MKSKPTGRIAAAGRAAAGRTLPRGKARGFTLVELLVVITIIGLLMMILVPTVRMALVQAELAKTKAWVVEIAGGCSTFQSSFNIYPGQDDLAKIGADGAAVPPVPLTAKYTGSQYLAQKMMLGPTVYIPFRSEDIRTVAGMTNTITDRSSNPMAVLYYVAKIGVKDVTQYDVNQNIEYLKGNSGVADAQIATEFPKKIKDERFTTAMPVNPGGIIIIAPGKDRKYLTEDDIRYP